MQDRPRMFTVTLLGHWYENSWCTSCSRRGCGGGVTSAAAGLQWLRLFSRSFEGRDEEVVYCFWM